MPTRETFAFCASCNSKFSIKETCYKCSNLIHDICDKCTAKSCSCCLQKDLTKMNQKKIEIKSCDSCKMLTIKEHNNYGYITNEYHCQYYNEDLPKDLEFDPTYKPDFCKVKNIIVEEE